MELDELLEKLSKLRLFQKDGKRAPHKPILLLYALGQWQQGRTEIQWTEHEERLQGLLAQFSNGKPSMENPFVRLTNDASGSLWELTNYAYELGDNYSAKKLRDAGASGRLGSLFIGVLRKEQGNLKRIVHFILNNTFPVYQHDEVLIACNLDNLKNDQKKSKSIKTEDIVHLIWHELKKSDTIFKLELLENPLEIVVEDRVIGLYIRKLTSAYFKDRPDVSRVQLHDSKAIKDLEEKGIQALVLGYCPESQAVVFWPPGVISSRFNKKKNVSLYSRFSFQFEAGQTGGIISFSLSNGDVIIGAHISALSEVILHLLPQTHGITKATSTNAYDAISEIGRNQITDSEALTQILEDNPLFTFADAVDVLRSNRESF